MDTFMASAIGAIGWVIPTSLQASVLVVLVLVVQALFRRKLTPRWSYALWFVVVVRLVMPVAPSSSFSVFNLLTLPENLASPMIALFEQQASELTPDYVAPINVSVEIPRNTSAPITPPGTTAPSLPPNAVGDGSGSIGLLRDVWQGVWGRVATVWIAGMLALGVCMIAGNVSLLRRVRRCRPVTDAAVLNELEDCKERLGVTTPIAVVAVDWDRGPALFGWLRPRILVPSGLVRKPDPIVLRHIFLHEIAHHKRRDILANWLTSALLLVHWFNPVLWLAFYRMRTDRELACDALALTAVEPDEARAYGNTILALLERTRTFRSVPGVVGIVEGKSALKRRIAMIALFKKGSYGWSVLALAVFAVLACVGLTNARTEALTETVPVERSESNVRQSTPVQPPPAVPVVVPTPPASPKVDDTFDSNPKPPRVPEWAIDVIDSPISLEFKNAHLSKVLASLSESLGLNFVIDTRVVRSEGEAVDPQLKTTEPATERLLSGHVASIKLDDVSVRGALSALLRPLGLDYAFEDRYIWISTPELLKAEGFVGQIGTKAVNAQIQNKPQPTGTSRTTPMSSAEARLHQEAAQRASDQNNLKQLGLVMKMFSNESQKGEFPKVDGRPGRLMMDQASVYPNLLFDFQILRSPWMEPATDADAAFDDTSYWYIPYATQDEAAGLAFVKAYRDAMANNVPLPKDLEYSVSGGTMQTRLLREGIERFFIKDINNPAASAIAQSQIPTMVGRPRQWADGKTGANVLFMDGHAEFMEYPGKYPMTEAFIGALVGLDDIKDVAASSSNEPAIPALATPRFQIRWVSDNATDGLAVQDSDGKTLILAQEILASESDVAEVASAPDENAPLQYHIIAQFKEVAAARIKESTTANKGKRLALLFDGKLLAAPVVRDTISSHAQITGRLSKTEADEFVAAFADLEFQSHRVVFSDGGVKEPVPAAEVPAPDFAPGKTSSDVSNPRFQMRWIAAENDDPQDAISVAGIEGSETFTVLPQIVIGGNDIAEATAKPVPNEPLRYRVNLRLTAAGTKVLNESTSKNVGRRLAILFDGKVISAPVVRDSVDEAVHTGTFSRERADEIVAALQQPSGN